MQLALSILLIGLNFTTTSSIHNTPFRQHCVQMLNFNKFVQILNTEIPVSFPLFIL